MAALTSSPPALPSPSRRLLFDVSTSLRWSGPPVGIVRVERELAKWALKNDANCQFVFFDPDLQEYRAVRRTYLNDLLEGVAIIDTTGMRDASQFKPRKTDRVPRSMLGLFLWVTQSRRMAIRTLERLRLNTNTPSIRGIISSLQRFIGGNKYRQILTCPDGNRRSLIPPDMAVDASISFQAGDIVFFAGSNWTHSNVRYMREQQRRVPVQLVTLCYDIIPLLFPGFFKSHDVVMLKRHFEIAFSISSLIFTTSNVVSRDIQRYCAEHEIPVGPVQQIPLGFDLPDTPSVSVSRSVSLPWSRYIMLVSTIEPRKGHRLVQAVWSKLLQEGVLERLDVTLLLVGRPGWMVDDLMEVISATDRITIMDNVDDCRLAELYDNAAFCIYPSEYEGYGLPVVEALGRGKAILASDVGIVPELQSRLLKRLPPDDFDAWYSAIKGWLTDPPFSENRNEGISFHHPTWRDAASLTFARIYNIGLVTS